MNKFKGLFKRYLPIGAVLAVAASNASAASVLSGVDFSGISAEITTAAAALAAVYVVVAGVRLALRFIRGA
uniref:Phage coat protein n=1 Tax=Dulem virus 57 TaxID=3145768 RepID=A0AAU8B359_9VIRU